VMKIVGCLHTSFGFAVIMHQAGCKFQKVSRSVRLVIPPKIFRKFCFL
jgi:hypothetical protein